MKSDEALEQIEFLKELTARTQLKAAYSYPYLILWGILSITGYLGSFALPNYLWNSLWSIISIVGMILCFIIGIKQIKKYGYTQLLKRIGLQCLVLLLADMVIFRLLIANKVYDLLSAYWPFQFGIMYIIASIHMGRDMTYIGIWMIITALLSFWMPLSFQNIWLAITYGGGLIFTGLLFRYQIKKTENNIIK